MQISRNGEISSSYVKTRKGNRPNGGFIEADAKVGFWWNVTPLTTQIIKVSGSKILKKTDRNKKSIIWADGFILTSFTRFEIQEKR